MSSTPETFNKPFPDRILNDIGIGFTFGAMCGSYFHFIKSWHNSPRGQRFYNGLTAVRINAPRIGGRFAACWGLLSACECTMVYLRKKEDPWNSIISGSVVSGLLEVRRGVGPAATCAVFGGCLLALLEGGLIMLDRSVSVKQPRRLDYADGAPPATFRGDEGKTWLFFDGTEDFETFDSIDF